MRLPASAGPFRSLFRDARLSLAVVVLLALGIGANAAVFSVVDRVLIRAPAGVKAPDQIRRLYLRTHRTIGDVETVDSRFTYAAFRAMDRVLAPGFRLAAYTAPDSAGGWLSMAGQPQRLSYATSGYFSTLGVRPALGRFFAPHEDSMEAGADVAVLSHGYWKRRFGSDPAAIGSTLRMGGRRFTVIGIAPSGFTGIDLDATDVWVPLSALRQPPVGDDPWYRVWRSPAVVLQLIARLPPGTPGGLLAARTTIAYRRGWLAEGFPDTTDTILTGPIQEALAPSTLAAEPSPASRLAALAERLFAVPLLVALIAAANVASLLLARAEDRRREFAIRVALGVPGRRLLGGVLLDSLLLSMLAAVAALAVGDWAAAGLRALVAPTVHWAGAPVDARVAGFAFLLALLIGLAAGAPSALRAARSDPAELLAAGPRAGGGRRSRLRPALLGAQTMLSFLLLVGAGLFVRSLLRVEGIDLGYATDRIVAGDVLFRDAKGGYLNFFDDAHRNALVTGFPAAEEALRGRPEIAGVAVANAEPMQGYVMATLRIPGMDSVPRLDNRDPALVAVGPGYFATSGTRVIRGRSFSKDDRRGAAPVLVVNETAARLFWPGGNPLGHCIFMKFDNGCRTIVGVAADAHLTKLIERPTVRLYVPLAQIGSATSQIFIPRAILVRAAPGKATEALAAVRGELRRQFPDAAVIRAARLSDLLAPQLRPWRVGADLFTALGLLAILIAVLGVFSVVSYQVTRRTREVGVRMALGATPMDILRLFAARGLVPVYAAILLGAVAALGAGRLVAPLLYETSPRDPAIFAGAATLLAAAALAAAMLAGWQAARLQPGEVLRTE